MQHEFGAPMIRPVQSLCKRLAAGLALAAMFGFMLDGALGSNHHLSAAPGHHHEHPHDHGGHAHVHGETDSLSHHQVGHGIVPHGADVAAADQDAALPTPAPDADALCYLHACAAAIVLPCMNAQKLPFILAAAVSAVQPGPAKGVEPAGPRKPPRTSAPT